MGKFSKKKYGTKKYGKVMKAFFLDRDGVINKAFVVNKKPISPTVLKDFILLPGVKEALNLTKKASFLNIVVTNQPDIKAGTIKKEEIEAMHKKMQNELPIDDIFVCYDREAPCYKPKPGMLLEAAKKHDIDLTQSYMVGDRWRDIGAGNAAGCKTIFIDYSYEETLKEKPDFVCKSLLEGVQMVLK